MKDIGLKQIRPSGCRFYCIHPTERNSSGGVRRSRNVNNSMKAKCPFCIDGCNKCVVDECRKCEGSGKIDVKLAYGNIWTRACTICGFENGGRIQKGDKEPSEPSGRCIVCGAPTKWVMLGSTEDIMGNSDEIVQARA